MHKKTFRHLSYEPIALIPLFDEWIINSINYCLRI
jgi:hypothetical protein